MKEFSMKTRILQTIVTFTMSTIIILLCNGCQNATEPTNIIANNGADITVTVKNQANKNVNVSVFWKLLIGKNSSTEFQSLRQIQNGTFREVLPIELTDTPAEQVRFVFLTRYNGADVATYAGSLPYNGNSRFDTVIACGLLQKEIILTQQTQPVCCRTVLPPQNFEITINSPLFSADTAYSSIVNLNAQSPCDAPMTIQPPNIIPADTKFETKAKINSPTGSQIVSLPFTFTPITGSSVQWMIIYKDPPTTITSSSNHTVNFVLASSTDPQCITGTGTIERETIVTTNCDCPFAVDTTIIHPQPPSPRDEICIKTSPKRVAIPLPKISNTSKDNCRLVVTLRQRNAPTGISIISFNRGVQLFNGVEVPKGETVDSLYIDVQTDIAGIIDAEFIYDIQVINEDNTVKQCNTITIQYRGIGSIGLCNILPASSLFINNNVNNIAEIITCVNFTSDGKTLIIENTSNCPLDLTLNFSNARIGLFGAYIKDSAGNFNDVSDSRFTIKPKSRQTFYIRFFPSLSDVYPSGSCSGVQPIIDFTGTLTINGCTPQSIILRGKADIDCYSKFSNSIYQHGQADGSTKVFQNVLLISTNGESITQADRKKDSSALFVDRFSITGTAPNGTVNSADISSGVPTGFLKFWKAQTGTNAEDDICGLLENIMCDPSNQNQINGASSWSTTMNINVNDVIIFRYQTTSGVEYFGIFWIKKLTWSSTFSNAKPQVEYTLCYPFKR